jgi:hypothetical protein
LGEECGHKWLSYKGLCGAQRTENPCVGGSNRPWPFRRPLLTSWCLFRVCRKIPSHGGVSRCSLIVFPYCALGLRPASDIQADTCSARVSRRDQRVNRGQIGDLFAPGNCCIDLHGVFPAVTSRAVESCGVPKKARHLEFMAMLHDVPGDPSRNAQYGCC